MSGRADAGARARHNHPVSDDDYYVSNAVGHLVEDLSSDEQYVLLTAAQRTAALLWALHGLIRGDGVEGWIESLGQRSDDAVAALYRVGVAQHAVALEPAVALSPKLDCLGRSTFGLSFLDS